MWLNFFIGFAPGDARPKPPPRSCNLFYYRTNSGDIELSVYFRMVDLFSRKLSDLEGLFTGGGGAFTPTYDRSESANQLFDEDDLSKQKNQRMATLLGFSTDPSRQALLEELVKKGILAQVGHEDGPTSLPCLSTVPGIDYHPWQLKM